MYGRVEQRYADVGQSHVAHEVRNGLVPMKLYLNLLCRRLAHDAPSLEIADKVGSGFAALETVVNDLLQFTSHRDPQLAELPVAELLGELCESLAPQLAAQGIAVRTEASDQLRCTADPDMLRRALLNLVLNAIDVMPTGGELSLTAREQNSEIQITWSSGAPVARRRFRAAKYDPIPGSRYPLITTTGRSSGLGAAAIASSSSDAWPIDRGNDGLSTTLPHPPASKAAGRRAIRKSGGRNCTSKA